VETINKELLVQMIQSGHIIVQKHPSAQLYIYNYTPLAQYERVWNEVTLQCRGLILNEKQEVIAQPFKKFFNLGECDNQVLPNEPFEVYEKLDGSLGILYWLNDEPFIATRGSFTSEQAVQANRILKKKYSFTLPSLEKSKTYLFEIIYPENRIVVDYKGKEDLVLIAVVCNNTGKDFELPNLGFPIAKRYDGIKDFTALLDLEEPNKEGFVVKFSSGLRYKVKFKEYLRIHRIVTQVSSISIWEFLRSGKPLEELLDRVPDEFYNWVKRTDKELQEKFLSIEDQARSELKVFSTRRETALYIQTCRYPGIMYSMLDGKEYADAI
jgi:hypothetical protein